MNAPTAVDPLAALRGLHLPEPVGLWPLAPGWWMVFVAFSLLLFGAIAWRRHRRVSLARHALFELEQLSRGETDPQKLATTLSALLRRVALRQFGRLEVASLSGVSWQTFLRENGPSATRGTGFEGEFARWIAEAPYLPPEVAAVGFRREEVLGAAREWIRCNS